jgi:hypothetical protein
MTDPVERERRKYRQQKMARQWATGRRIATWLEVALFVAFLVAALIWGKGG